MRVIVAIWKDGKVEVFSTLPLFLEKYPGRNYQTIMHWISRKGEPYEDDEVTIHRSDVQKKTVVMVI
jgi:hypothetical protein